MAKPTCPKCGSTDIRIKSTRDGSFALCKGCGAKLRIKKAPGKASDSQKAAVTPPGRKPVSTGIGKKDSGQTGKAKPTGKPAPGSSSMPDGPKGHPQTGTPLKKADPSHGKPRREAAKQPAQTIREHPVGDPKPIKGAAKTAVSPPTERPQPIKSSARTVPETRLDQPPSIRPPGRLKAAAQTLPVNPAATVYAGAEIDSEAIRKAEADVSAEWNVGDVILDLYEVTGELGKGGMGKVYKVHHHGWNVDLAVKTPLPEMLERAGGAGQFKREAETWINLGLHPHIVSCYYVRDLGGIPRVFAEYVEGGSLHEWISDRRLYEGGLETALERMLDIAIQFAWGLNYSHRHRLVHQDVKPANVMMTRDGAVKVTDFGLAGAIGAAGTPQYQSPEQESAAARVNAGEPRSAIAPLGKPADVWSWGLSILEMFVGEVTWMFGRVAPDVLEAYVETGPGDDRFPPMPQALVQLLKKCFASEPSRRYQDMEEVAGSLIRIYEEATGRPYPGSEPRAALDNADTLNNRAVSMLDLGRTEQAESLLEKALAVDANHPRTAYNQMLLQWRKGLIDRAEVLRRLDEVTKSRPHDWNATYITALMHMELNDFETAQRLLEEIRSVEANQDEMLSTRTQAGEYLPKTRKTIGYAAVSSIGSRAACFMPDGVHVLSGGGNQPCLKLWDASTGRCKNVLPVKHQIEFLAVSNDGSLALCSGDTHITLLDIASGATLRDFTGHDKPVTSIRINRDNTRALSASQDGTARVWDVATGRCLLIFEGHQAGLTSLDVDPGGSRAVSCDTSGELLLWETETGRLIHQFPRGGIQPMSVCFTRDGKHVLSTGRKSIEVHDANSFQCVQKFEGLGQMLSTSRNGRYVLSGGNGKKFGLWDVTSGRCLRSFNARGKVSFVALSDNASQAVTIQSGSLAQWDVKSSRRVRVFGSGPSSSILCLRLTSDGARVLTGGGDGKLQVWDCFSGDSLRTYQGHQAQVAAIDLSSDSRRAVTGGWDKAVRHWDVETGKCLHVLEGHETLVQYVSMSADGDTAISTDANGHLWLWDLKTGSGREALVEANSGILPYAGLGPVRLSPNGKKALVCSKRGLKLWDVETDRELWILDPQATGHLAMDFGSDGRHAATSHYGPAGECFVKFWDVVSQTCLHTFPTKQNPSCIRLTEDSRYVVCRVSDQLVVFNSETGRQELDLPILWHTAEQSLDLSADGMYIVITDGSKLTMFMLNLFDAYRAPLALCRVRASKELMSDQALFDTALSNARHQLEGGDAAAALAELRRVSSLPAYARRPEVAELQAGLYLHLPRKGFLDWRETSDLPDTHSSILEDAAFSDNGKYALTSGSSDPNGTEWELKLWDLSAGRFLRSIGEHKGRILGMCFSRDSKYAVTGSGYPDKVLRMWEISTGRCIRTFETYGGLDFKMQFSPDGRHLLVAGSAPREVFLYDVATRRVLRTFEAARSMSALTSVSWSPDGRYFLSSSTDRSIKLWEISTGKCLKTLTTQCDTVLWVAYGRNGRRAFSSEAGPGLAIFRSWDLTTGECLRSSEDKRNYISVCSLSRDGRYLLGATTGSGLQIWDLDTLTAVRELDFSTHDLQPLRVHLTENARFALCAGKRDKTIKRWFLDWELDEREPADWDDAARPYLESFLVLHTPYLRDASGEGEANGADVKAALTHTGKASWNESDFQQLLRDLACAGLGWLRPEGIRKKLEVMNKPFEEIQVDLSLTLAESPEEESAADSDDINAVLKRVLGGPVPAKEKSDAQAEPKRAGRRQARLDNSDRTLKNANEFPVQAEEIMPDQPQKKIRADEEDKKEGFWSRLFGKRKK